MNGCSRRLMSIDFHAECDYLCRVLRAYVCPRVGRTVVCEVSI